VIRYGKTLRLVYLAATAFVLIGVVASSAHAGALGETFTCHFGRYGKVVIDTRAPGSTISINGRRYPILDGSYFFQTKDGKIAILFGPNMGWWEYNDIRDNHCNRRPNKPSRQRK
jgi:hypothetical protein